MKCPNCDTILAMSERLGVEIDYCPQCRGVWLDRGEIDRLLESERAQAAPTPVAVGAPPPQPAPMPVRDDERGSDPYRRKRKWSDLLEFD